MNHFYKAQYHNIHIIPMRSGKEKDRKEDSIIINNIISFNYST